VPRLPSSAAFARRLGARVRLLRKEAKLTQEHLAWECDLNKGFLSQVEAGKRVPSVAVLMGLARRLDVELADLFVFPGANPRLALLDAARREDRAAVRALIRRLGLE
jgi:transcriptional regulator with XRE-family HTH domain